MGVVYLAEDLVLGRVVALKTLPYISGLAQQRARIEGQLMARVTHQNLATILGFETYNGRPILVVEYLPRGTLADYLRSQQPSISQVIDWGLGLCDGLCSPGRAAALLATLWSLIWHPKPDCTMMWARYGPSTASIDLHFLPDARRLRSIVRDASFATR